MKQSDDIFIHPTAVIDEGAAIAPGCRIWHFSHIMTGAEVGSGCNIGQNVFIASGTKLGRDIKIQNNAYLCSGVTLEDGVFLGPSCVFTNVINPRSEFPKGGNYTPTMVHKGATIGANVTIICGIEIGEYAFVGAGAVVTHNVAPYSLVTGVPARHTGWMSRAGCKLEFDADGYAVCPQTGDRYHIKDGSVCCMPRK